MKPSYLCVLYFVNNELKHPNFEILSVKEAIFLTYVILDVSQNKIVGVQQYTVNPEMLLLAEFVQESPTEEMLSNSCESLGSAIQQFHQYVETTLNIDLSTNSLCFVTDGQLPLRHYIYPQASSKNIKLPQYYAFFYDLHKEFQACYGVPSSTTMSINKILTFLQMEPYKGSEYCKKKIGDMVNITLRLIREDHTFENPDRINLRLVPKIYESSDQVEDDSVVEMMGIPNNCSEQQIANFFIGLNLADGGVALCLRPNGRRNGRAVVRFENRENCDLALKRHKHCLANIHIDVKKASGQDFITVAGGDNEEANAFLSRGAEVIIRMTDLPYSCTAKDVLSFFAEGESSCEVMLGEEGVFFVKNLDGNATGIALVLFAREEDAVKALRKTSDVFGPRYIHKSRITPAEVQQVLKYAEFAC